MGITESRIDSYILPRQSIDRWIAEVDNYTPRFTQIPAELPSFTICGECGP